MKLTGNFGDNLEKMMVEEGKKQIKEHLRKAKISGLTVIAKKVRGEWKFSLEGPQEQLDKAAKVLKTK